MNTKKKYGILNELEYSKIPEKECKGKLIVFVKTSRNTKNEKNQFKLNVTHVLICKLSKLSCSC